MLGYNIPINKKFASKLRTYFSIQNLYTWDKYDGGFSPEASTYGSKKTGYDFGSYPMARVYTLGVNMKRLNYIISGLLSLSISLSSCDEFLNVEPSDARTIQYFYTNPKEAQQALMGVYNGLLPISSYYLMLSDVRSDDVWTGMPDDNEQNYMAFNAFRKQISQISTLEAAWTDYYEIIARANVLLEKIENLAFDEKIEGFSVKESFIAEARFLRAFAYFDLVRFFGRVPAVTSSQTVDEAMKTPQSEAKDIYENIIIPDLEYAINHMGDIAYGYNGNESASGRATKPAAQALLGRVYWTMAGFPLWDNSKKAPAMELLETVIDNANAGNKYWAKDSKEWKKIWISDNDNKYHIFEIQYAMQSGYGNPMIFSSLPKVSSSLSHVTMSGNKINSSKSLRNLYRENSGEIRFLPTIRKGESYFEKLFENIMKRDTLGFSKIDDQIVDRNSFPINYPLIRLEDVMLMYADLAGPTDKGVEMVNKIRVRAGLKELSASQKTTEAFKNCVLDERRRELAGEGIRWHDIVRSGNFTEYIKAAYILEGNEGISAAGNVQEGMYVYPIPDKQLLVNDGLYTQNEAYK